jgi:4,4'-diaponeurosporenoate glycosyltransferase
MMLPALLIAGGLIAGIFLLRRVPTIPLRMQPSPTRLYVTVIVPARNEANNLPHLFESLGLSQEKPWQVLVVDDGSTDDTAAVASRYGAKVVTSALLPEGWTGKTWACHQGALAATGEVLFFLDADTRFAGNGYGRIIEYFSALDSDSVLSLLPFHVTHHWYEELSIFFNILVAMGAGGFGKLDAPHLFGQSLLVRRELYFKAGGHNSVKNEVLENLHFAAKLREAGGKLNALGGRYTLEMRMFPQGLSQLRESWQKAFVTGAGKTSPLVLILSSYWLGTAMLAALALLAIHSSFWPVAAALYALYVIQIGICSQQLGTFRWLAVTFYPVSLIFYFGIFGQSMWRRRRGQHITWRGREL